MKSTLLPVFLVLLVLVVAAMLVIAGGNSGEDGAQRPIAGSAAQQLEVSPVTPLGEVRGTSTLERNQVVAQEVLEPPIKTMNVASVPTGTVVAWADERARQNLPLRHAAIASNLAKFNTDPADEKVLVGALRSLALQSAFAIYDAQGKSYFPGQPGDSVEEVRRILREQGPRIRGDSASDTHVFSNGGALYEIPHGVFPELDELIAIEARYHPGPVPLGELPVHAVIERANEALTYH